MFNEENELDFDENAAIEDDEADEENGLGERERIIPDINLFRAFTRKRTILTMQSINERRQFCLHFFIKISFSYRQVIFAFSVKSDLIIKGIYDQHIQH